MKIKLIKISFLLMIMYYCINRFIAICSYFYVDTTLIIAKGTPFYVVLQITDGGGYMLGNTFTIINFPLVLVIGAFIYFVIKLIYDFYKIKKH